MARYINVGVWFWLLASDVSTPVGSNGDFWDVKLRQAFSINSDMFNAPAMLGRAVAVLILWFAFDQLLRWLWGRTQPSHE
jgi:hypothetical protein